MGIGSIHGVRRERADAFSEDTHWAFWRGNTAWQALWTGPTYPAGGVFMYC